MILFNAEDSPWSTVWGLVRIDNLHVKDKKASKAKRRDDLSQPVARSCIHQGNPVRTHAGRMVRCQINWGLQPEPLDQLSGGGSTWLCLPLLHLQSWAETLGLSEGEKPL